MKTTIISAAGVVQDTGEVLPDRENMTPKSIDGCRKTGASICSSADMCKDCAQALERIIARMPPIPNYTDEDIEAIKKRSRKGKHG